VKFKWLRLVFPLLFLSFFLHASETVLPQKVDAPQETSAPVVAHLHSEDKTIQAGHPFWVGVELKMADGWDTYWINPGDAGFPTKVEWHLPEGYKVGPIHWPTPERFVSQSLVGFGYTHSVLLLAEVTPPAHPTTHEALIEADVSWLACKEQCVPGNAHVKLSLPVKGDAPQKNSEVSTLFQEARAQWPKDLPGVSAGTKEQEIVLNFKPVPGDFKEIVDAVFIPEMGEMIDYLAPQQLHQDAGAYTLNVKRAHPEQTPPSHVKGVLLIGEKGATIKKGIQVDTPIVATVAGHDSHSLSFPLALLFAFLGGLILNVMPCVLPVIAIKIFGFVKIAGEKRGTILKHGGAFALGVLLSFWILSVLLLVLRAFGHGLGWGFQLQEPLFVIVLTIILFLLALSLFGVLNGHFAHLSRSSR
jgi:DsbC/DsbD-like thiol-disulfide interchange protein